MKFLSIGFPFHLLSYRKLPVEVSKSGRSTAGVPRVEAFPLITALPRSLQLHFVRGGGM